MATKRSTDFSELLRGSSLRTREEMAYRLEYALTQREIDSAYAGDIIFDIVPRCHPDAMTMRQWVRYTAICLIAHGPIWVLLSAVGRGGKQRIAQEGAQFQFHGEAETNRHKSVLVRINDALNIMFRRERPANPVVHLLENGDFEKPCEIAKRLLDAALEAKHPDLQFMHAAVETSGIVPVAAVAAIVVTTEEVKKPRRPNRKPATKKAPVNKAWPKEVQDAVRYWSTKANVAVDSKTTAEANVTAFAKAMEGRSLRAEMLTEFETFGVHVESEA